MPSPALLELLRCPSTRQPLRRAPDKLVWFLESERVAGRLMNDEGNPVEESFESGLVREDGLAFYPIRNGIPVMLECVPVGSV
jgi:uncharacterized protein YbaR (Trm112 family)